MMPKIENSGSFEILLGKQFNTVECLFRVVESDLHLKERKMGDLGHLGGQLANFKKPQANRIRSGAISLAYPSVFSVYPFFSSKHYPHHRCVSLLTS